MNQSAAYFYKQMPTLCGSRKYPYPRQRWSLEIPKGEGGGGGGGVISIAQVFKRKYEAKLEIPGGGRVQTKEPSLGEVWIFLEPHIIIRLPFNY